MTSQSSVQAERPIESLAALVERLTLLNQYGEAILCKLHRARERAAPTSPAMPFVLRADRPYFKIRAILEKKFPQRPVLDSVRPSTRPHALLALQGSWFYVDPTTITAAGGGQAWPHTSTVVCHSHRWANFPRRSLCTARVLMSSCTVQRTVA